MSRLAFPSLTNIFCNRQESSCPYLSPRSPLLLTALLLILPADIDECKLGLDTCNKNVSTCENAPGTYTCACESGYFRYGQACISEYLVLFSSFLSLVHSPRPLADFIFFL